MADVFGRIDGWRNDPPKADSPCEFQSLPAASRLRSSTTLATTRCENHCAGEVLLDNAFVLIEGHYPPVACLDFRFLFAYDDASFRGPMVRRHELTHRVNAHGAARPPQSVGIAGPHLYCFLRMPGNAETLALLSSENLAQSRARSLSRRCESDQPALDSAFREGPFCFQRPHSGVPSVYLLSTDRTYPACPESSWGVCCRRPYRHCLA